MEAAVEGKGAELEGTHLAGTGDDLPEPEENLFAGLGEEDVFAGGGDVSGEAFEGGGGVHGGVVALGRVGNG